MPLIAGAETEHFLRFVGAEVHGSRPALRDWRPDTREEAAKYIEECVTRLAEFARSSDESGVAARAGLGRHLRALVSHAFIDTVETVVNQVQGADDPWTEAIESLGHFLKYDVSETNHHVATRVRKLIADLQPRDWQSRVRYLVTEMPWDFPCGEKLDFQTQSQRQAEAVHALAVQIAEEPTILKSVLPQISCGRQRMAAIFGESIARSVDSPLEWLERITLVAVEAPEQERNFDLLSGYITGIAENHPSVVGEFKERAASSPGLASALPLICRQLGIVPSDIELVIGALQAGLLPPWQLIQWTLGGVLAELPVPSVALLFDTMLDHSNDGFLVGVDLMGMYTHGAPDRLNGLRPQVRKAAENVIQWKLPHGKSMAALDHFQKIMRWMLEKSREDDDARATALALARALVNVAERNTERFIEPVLPILLSGLSGDRLATHWSGDHLGPKASVAL